MAVHEYPQSHGSLAGLSDTDHHTQYGLMLPPGPASARPTGPWRFGRMHYATDTGAVSFDQGAGWVTFAGLAYAQTWTALQTFSGSMVVSSTSTSTESLRVNGMAGQTVDLIGARRSGATYSSFRVRDTGLVCSNDGLYVESTSSSSTSIVIQAWSNTQTSDFIRALHNNGTVLSRITSIGEVHSAAGVRAAVSGSTTQTTSSGVDLFIDSLFK